MIWSRVIFDDDDYASCPSRSSRNDLSTSVHLSFFLFRLTGLTLALDKAQGILDLAAMGAGGSAAKYAVEGITAASTQELTATLSVMTMLDRERVQAAVQVVEVQHF